MRWTVATILGFLATASALAAQPELIVDIDSKDEVIIRPQPITEAEVEKLVRDLHASGVQTLLVRMGHLGYFPYRTALSYPVGFDAQHARQHPFRRDLDAQKLEQAARAFLVTVETIRSWLKRVDEQGPDALVQLREPVNRFPDFVRYLVQQFKALCPMLGKVTISQILARAGLHLGATTVGRILKEEPVHRPTEDQKKEGKNRVVTSKYPNHLWQIDLTTVPIGPGFWTTWRCLSAGLLDGGSAWYWTITPGGSWASPFFNESQPPRWCVPSWAA